MWSRPWPEIYLSISTKSSFSTIQNENRKNPLKKINFSMVMKRNFRRLGNWFSKNLIFFCHKMMKYSYTKRISSNFLVKEVPKSYFIHYASLNEEWKRHETFSWNECRCDMMKNGRNFGKCKEFQNEKGNINFRQSPRVADNLNFSCQTVSNYVKSFEFDENVLVAFHWLWCIFKDISQEIRVTVVMKQLFILFTKSSLDFNLTSKSCKCNEPTLSSF